MWSAVNVLAKSPKIADLTKRDDFQVTLSYINLILGKSDAVHVPAMFGTREHVYCGRVL